MQSFDYHRPASIGEVEQLLAAYENPRLISGGMSLLPMMKFGLVQPEALIDLGRVEVIKGVITEEDGLRIGAMTRHVDVANSPIVRHTIPGLAELAGGIGDRQVRNRGTIGGSVANADPAACYPSAILGLGAKILTNRRAIAADVFFLDVFETALEDGEFIIGFHVPRPEACAYEKFRQMASRFALVGVFVARFPDGSVRVAVTGASSHAFRCHELEQALMKDFSVAAAEAVEVNASELNSDLHADADYRASLIPIVAGRAVARIMRAV